MERCINELAGMWMTHGRLARFLSDGWAEVGGAMAKSFLGH